MNILLISQCNKSALIETRRILDQFAERKGDRTWQTDITQQGLITLRKILRKTARRNTAVACHWLKSHNRTELLWIVGNLSRFNERGVVPTNSTEQDILRDHYENLWHTLEDIGLLAGVAGLFHDFGKANRLFQDKLNGKRKFCEPYRHEWISLRLFEAFVGDLSDREWLEKLSLVEAKDEEILLKKLFKDGPPGKCSNPFFKLPPLARAVGWLIVSHHHLPAYPIKKNEPRLAHISGWMAENKWFDGSWNSKQVNDRDWDDEDWQKLWSFKHGTPLLSSTWRAKAQEFGQRALRRPELVKQDWLGEDRFSSHLARMVLMLADHTYSASAARACWQDQNYPVYANSDPQTRILKQKLDEHNVGVGRNALRIAKILPDIRLSLPSISRHKAFKKRSINEKFRWQDKSYDLACSIRERAAKQGFFGINMASTGCGKTFANSKIMYGLANEKLGCRFSIALGLRTLTLQTGDALRERLHLGEDDLAVLIGSQAIKDLHEFSKNNESNLYTASGSESAEDFISEHQYVCYEGALDDGLLSYWLKKSPKLHQLISAPVLVSTIDHLIPATEGTRGGRQIAPMLRLLTSDLILDEPDDFDLNDLPAVCRLVNWAGMLGSRILLSSATLPPVLVKALFDAYAAGRKIYQKAAGEMNLPNQICCAWFDEFHVHQSDHEDVEDFIKVHENFVKNRVEKLTQAKPLRLAKLSVVTPVSKNPAEVISAIAEVVSNCIFQLHQEHHQSHLNTRQQLSVGLVRMANIGPLVAVAEKLFTIEPPIGYCIHYCVYHSQHPLIVRSAMEKQLDVVLTRHNPNKIWLVPEIQSVLQQYPRENHIFVVLATPVAEVGRDHDYDWAIVEPSSMRSLIQLGGRIQRHRLCYPKSANMIVLAKNYNALCGKDIAYEKPGFESTVFPLVQHDLSAILTIEQLQHINAIPRIQMRSQLDHAQNLADLEHVHLHAKLYGSKYACCAALWWQRPVDWCAEMQRRTRFREKAGDEKFFLYFEGDEDPVFFQLDAEGGMKSVKYVFRQYSLASMAPRVHIWANQPLKELIIQYAEKHDVAINQACLRFGEIRLQYSENRQDRWAYHPLLGVFRPLI